MIKIGTVELTDEEVQRYYNEGRYLVTNSRIYKIIRKNGAFRGKEVYASKGIFATSSPWTRPPSETCSASTSYSEEANNGLLRDSIQ